MQCSIPLVLTKLDWVQFPILPIQLVRLWSLDKEISDYLMISANFVPNLISDAEVKLREAYRIAEANHRRSQQLQHQSNLLESQHRRDTNVMIYIRRRLAMCARKLGKLKEASVPNFFFPKILARICRYLPICWHQFGCGIYFMLGQN